MTDHEESTDLTRLVSVTAVASEPVEMTIDATESERKKLSEVLELLDIGRLHARLRLVSPDGGVTIHLSGLVEADLTQSCVVSLEPVESRIETKFERIYSAQENPDDGNDITIAPDADEPLEPLTGDTIDIGQAVVEQLALEIDPFPRAAGVDFLAMSSVETGDDGEPPGPFAALSKLKRNAE